MTVLTIPTSCPFHCAASAIQRETRYSEITSFKVRDNFIHVEYERKPPCPPQSS